MAVQRSGEKSNAGISKINSLCMCILKIEKKIPLQLQYQKITKTKQMAKILVEDKNFNVVSEGIKWKSRAIATFLCKRWLGQSVCIRFGLC